MKALRILFTLLFALGLSGGCASAPERPAWVAGNPTDYPPQRYLTGRGQGDRSAAARDRARADLAKNFQVRVTEESSDLLSYTRTEGGAASSSRLESEVSRNIVTRTDQVIEGVRIAELWQDEETGTFHALAVLDRLQVANQLRTLVSELDREVVAQVQRARAEEDLLAKIGAARRALAAEVERRHYAKYLQVVSPTGMRGSGTYEAGALKADLTDLRARLRIRPEAEADPLGGLERAAAGALAEAGFLHESGTDPTHILTLRETIQETAGRDGWHWVRGTLQVSLRSAAGRVVGTHRWPIKASAQQGDLARARAADQVEALLKQELGDAIVAFGSSPQP